MYYKFKKIVRPNVVYNETINTEKLGYNFFSNDVNYIVRSDTGTGKTTSFKHYAKSMNLKFITWVDLIIVEKYKISPKTLPEYTKAHLQRLIVVFENAARGSPTENFKFTLQVHN